MRHPDSVYCVKCSKLCYSNREPYYVYKYEGFPICYQCDRARFLHEVQNLELLVVINSDGDILLPTGLKILKPYEIEFNGDKIKSVKIKLSDGDYKVSNIRRDKGYLKRCPDVTV